MGELTASIAHEINQPMSAILSNVDAAEMLLDANELDRRELRQILSDIRGDDLRASEIIRHIRGLANKRQADAERFDVNELVRMVLRLVAPTVKRRGMSLEVELNRVPLIHADRIHVQQVLLNLLFNAMDAMSSTPEHDRSIRIVTSSVRPHTSIASSTRSSRRSGTAWASAFRSRARSSRRTAAGSGRRTTRTPARRSASRCASMHARQ